MLFDPNSIYYCHLSQCTFSNLREDIISDILKDGRYSSPFMEKWLEAAFSNLQYQSGNAPYDCIYTDRNVKPLEIRGVSLKNDKRKTNLIPSNMIGAGRKYDQQQYIQKLAAISGFIITYPVISYRDIVIFHLPASFILNAGNSPIKDIDASQIKNYLHNSPERLVDWIKSSQQCIDNKIYQFDIPIDFVDTIQ